MKQKLSQEYFKYLLSDAQIASKALNSLFRIYFLSLIAFVFAPILSSNTPFILKEYKIFFIITLLCSILGIVCEFLSSYLALKGARGTASAMFERTLKIENDTSLIDFEKITEPVGYLHIYMKSLLVVKTILAAIGGLAISWPLLNWLGNL